MTHRIKTIAIAATASALTMAGMAVAHGDRERGDRHSGPSAFAAGKSLTYSETHYRRDGEDVAFRVDQGRVVTASDSAISIRRNDGETVDVPVDDDTKVWGGWSHRWHAKASHHGERDRAGVADIPEGKRVLVVRSDDDPAAEAVTVAKRHRHFHRHDRDGSRHDRDDDGGSRHHDRDDD